MARPASVLPGGSAARCSSSVRVSCRGRSPTRLAGRSSGDGTRRPCADGPTRSGRPTGASGWPMSGWTRKSRRWHRRRRRHAPVDTRRRRLAARADGPAEGHPGGRPPGRRGIAVVRTAQEVAPVREQGAGGRGARRRCRRGPAAGLPRADGGDGVAGRDADPGRVGLSRRVGGVRAVRRRSAPVRPRHRRRARGGPVPAPLRRSRRRAVRRHDRGRRRVEGELPREMGGDPVVARGGGGVVRHVGPRPPGDPPVQGRLRGSRGRTDRRLGSAARSTRCDHVSAGRAGPRPIAAEVLPCGRSGGRRAERCPGRQPAAGRGRWPGLADSDGPAAGS